MGGKARILVVEDDQAMRELLELVLADAGYEVVTAEHGQAALEAVRARPPDVILLDLVMPVLDGWAFARAYSRSRLPRAPIVALTAVREAEGWEAPVGVATMLPKPFELDALLQVVAEQAKAAITPWGLPASGARGPAPERPVERSGGCAAGDAGASLGASVPLAEVRAELADIEALERQVADLLAALRAVLPPEQFALVWALRDAEEALGLAERLLEGRRPVGAPAWPVHAGDLAPREATADGAPAVSATGDGPDWARGWIARSEEALRAAHQRLARIRIVPHG